MVTFWGDPITVVLPEVVSRNIYEFRIWEPKLTGLFLDRVKPGWVVFDVGAHCGYFSLLASHLGAEVHAFEPTPTTCRLLKSNLGDRGRVIQVALWNEGGVIDIADFGLSQSGYNSAAETNYLPNTNAQHILQVPATTIDDYVAETGATPNLVKLDVEKAEELVVAGAERTLANFKPLITVEVGEGDESRRLLDYMGRLDYRPFNITDEGVVSPHVLSDSYTHDNILLVHD